MNSKRVANFVRNLDFITRFMLSSPGKLPWASLALCMSSPKKAILSIPTCWTAWCGTSTFHFGEWNWVGSNGSLRFTASSVHVCTFVNDRSVIMAISARISPWSTENIKAEMVQAATTHSGCRAALLWLLYISCLYLTFLQENRLQISRRKNRNQKTVPFSLWLSACKVRIKLRKFRPETASNWFSGISSWVARTPSVQTL